MDLSFCNLDEGKARGCQLKPGSIGHTEAVVITDQAFHRLGKKNILLDPHIVLHINSNIIFKIGSH